MKRRKKAKKTKKSGNTQQKKRVKESFLTPTNLIAILATLIALGSMWYSISTYDLAFEQANNEKVAVF
jgi:hypothetical protein